MLSAGSEDFVMVLHRFLKEQHPDLPIVCWGECLCTSCASCPCKAITAQGAEHEEHHFAGNPKKGGKQGKSYHIPLVSPPAHAMAAACPATLQVLCKPCAMH